MKSILILLIIFSLNSSVFSQNDSKKAMYSGRVEYAQKTDDVDGTVTVNATGFDKQIIESKTMAVQSAFYNIIFIGIPGSKYSLPMIPDGDSKKNDPVLKSLFEGGYNSFVVSNSIIEEDKKARKKDGAKGYQCVLQLTINADGLRRYLEQNNLTRKFGF